MKTKILNNEKGVSLVLLALGIVVIFGFGALAIDIGHLYNVKNQLQVAADAAALAGAAKIKVGNDTTQTPARNEAQKIAALNVADVAYDAVPGFGQSPGAAEGQPIPVSLKLPQADGDILVGNWDGAIFLPNGLPVNAVKVTAKRWGDTESGQPNVQNWFAKIFGMGQHLGVDYDKDFSLASVSAVAIAAKEKLPFLPIAVNEYWHEDPKHAPGSPFGQIYPQSFMRSINAGTVTGVPDIPRGGTTFAIVGTEANANQAGFNCNSFVDILLRNKYHNGRTVDPITGGASWFEVVSNSVTGSCTPSCDSNLTPLPEPGVKTGLVNPQKYDQNFAYMFEGIPDNVIPPNAVREVIRPTINPYTFNNYTSAEGNDPSKCPYATIPYFSSSGTGPVGKKFDAESVYDGNRFYNVHPKGDRVLVMVYDGTHAGDAFPNQADAVTVVGYGVIEIDGYKNGPWNGSSKLDDKGGTAYGHAIPHGLAGEDDIYIIQPPSTPVSARAPDCSFTDKIRQVQENFAGVRLVDPSLKYGVHQQ